MLLISNYTSRFFLCKVFVIIDHFADCIGK